MTIITPTTKPFYWGIEGDVLVTGITPVGGQTVSGKNLIYDTDPKLFLSKVAAIPIAKTITDEIGSVYKDEKGIICLVKVDKTIETAVVAASEPIEEKPVEEIKIIK